MKFNDWIELPPDEQGKAMDNRNEPPIDVTDEHYHSKYDTISCPHCGCTLASHVVTAYHYCYVCGGRFAEKKLTCDRCDAQGTSRCDCEDDERIPKDFDCNDCAYCMSNCHDMSICCEDETGRCDYFELWENDKYTIRQQGNVCFPAEKGQQVWCYDRNASVVTWFTPEEKLPLDERMVIVTFTGRDGSILYDHALGVGIWCDNDNGWCKSGWIIEGLSDSAEYVIHAWCDLESYRG